MSEYLDWTATNIERHGWTTGSWRDHDGSLCLLGALGDQETVVVPRRFSMRNPEVVAQVMFMADVASAAVTRRSLMRSYDAHVMSCVVAVDLYRRMHDVERAKTVVMCYNDSVLRNRKEAVAFVRSVSEMWDRAQVAVDESPWDGVWAVVTARHARGDFLPETILPDQVTDLTVPEEWAVAPEREKVDA